MSPARKGSTPSLSEYERKRRFDDTPEPAGDAGAGEPASNRFVIHEHHARRLHWDLRLERDGVLVSWAIPNGIPEDPQHNRKAVHVEDHPLSYIDFQGTIPQGNYGAGDVHVWDRGTYETEKWEAAKITVVFHGERLSGRYALFRAGADEKDWMIHRMDPPADPEAEEIPAFIAPMRTTPGAVPPDASRWGFEIAWDGARAQVRSQPGRLAICNGDGADITAVFPEMRAVNRALGSHSALLDAEIVVLDAQGRPDPAALSTRRGAHSANARRHLAQDTPATLVIFDLLWLDGHPLLDLPYTDRRAQLQALGLQGAHWQVPGYHPGDGTGLLAAAGALGLAAIVAKRLDGPYRPGDGDWVRIATAPAD